MKFVNVFLIFALLTTQAISGVVTSYMNNATPDFTKLDGTRFPIPLASGLTDADVIVPLRVNADGSLQVTGSTGGGGGSGDASAANQLLGNASLASIDSKIKVDSSTTASITTSGSAQVSTTGYATVSFAVSGTWSGTIVVEASMDGTTWYPTTYNALSSGNSALQFTANTSGQVNTVGFSFVRLRGATLASGTANISFNASDKVSNVNLDNPLPAGTNNLGSIRDITGVVSLPTGASTEATLLGASNKLSTASSALPSRSDLAMPVSVKGQNIFRTSFASAISGGVDSSFFSLLQTGTGMTVNQTAGNLVLTSGTVANDETIIRSVSSFKGNLELKWGISLNQRIINNNFIIELVDVIGDGLAYVINSATSVTVTIPSNPFTSVNVGQSLTLQQVSGTAGTIPGRYTIASVSGSTVTFTVAGYPVSGSGTLSLVGWNYAKVASSGTVATTALFETQRRGYNSSSSFSATTLTTLTTGYMGIISLEDNQAFFADQLQSSALSLGQTRRAETVQSLPEENTPMFLQIRALNGTVAPASQTILTMGMASVTSRVTQNVAINSISPMSGTSSLPVSVLNTPSVVVSSGVITTVSAVTAVATVTAVTSIASANLAIPGAIADVASAAIITTTTTATIIPTAGISYQVNIPVTLVSGTLPTMDVDIQESDDSGVNWFTVYSFPRITATGFYRSPKMAFTGNRVRYVQTLSGTSPSFTRAINRLQSSDRGQPIRQLIDRSIVLTTLNSVTPSLNTQNSSNAQMLISIGTATTAPILQMEGSDDLGATWYALGSPLTAVASSTTQVTFTNVNSQLIRARVSTAGTVVVASYVSIKGF